MTRRLVAGWPMVLVLGCFAGAAVVVPTLAPVATTGDDWGYSRSVEILYYEGRLTVFPVVAATAVFQVLWGTLFALLFGMTLGITRLSTVVMMAIGALALYGTLRRLGVSRGRSALGAAAHLFNPLAFGLAFTFMTDPHFTSVLLIATYLYVRGLDPEEADARFTVAGAFVAGLAFLTRQQGALIPLAVVVYLLLSRRLRPNRTGLKLFVQVTALPVLMTAGYYLWLRYVNDVPEVQQSFLAELRQEGWTGTWQLIRHLTFFELMYLGFFALPLTLAALPWLHRVVRFASPAGWLLFCAWEAVVIAGVLIFAHVGRKMPYIPQFLGAGGIGPPDVVGSRRRLLDEAWMFDWITGVCAASSLVLGLILCRKLAAAATPDRAKAGLILSIGLWQVIGVLPPSYHYLGWASGSLDRYLLPLLPFGICLALWALRDVRIVQPVAWLVVAVFAVVSTAGTRDHLVFMETVWSVARAANAAGVPNDKLDAGSGWDGYYLYEVMIEENIARARSPAGAPWWVYFYAKPTDSTYVVATRLQTGHAPVWQREYSQWLQEEPTSIYLLRRHGAPWPPTEQGER